jgi:hypothetical protein
MKLRLITDENGLNAQLQTPDGQTIEGVVAIVLPTLETTPDDFPTVTVKFAMTKSIIHLGGGETHASKHTCRPGLA